MQTMRLRLCHLAFQSQAAQPRRDLLGWLSKLSKHRMYRKLAEGNGAWRPPGGIRGSPWYPANGGQFTPCWWAWQQANFRVSLVRTPNAPAFVGQPENSRSSKVALWLGSELGWTQSS